jgi:ribosomal protein S18 acetylase RimI-like enzyme
VQARRGELVDVLEGGAGVLAFDHGVLVGIATWVVTGDTAEVRALGVAEAARRRGVGRKLMDAAAAALRAVHVRRAWLVTTNDNTPAIRLYESLDYAVSEVRRGAIDETRRTIKPSIPLIGHGGLEMHDELELTRELVSAQP